MKIAIISSSVRDGRLSHRVALFLEKHIARTFGAQTEILDLAEYDFPIFHERLVNQADPSAQLRDFASRFVAADGIVIVTPVYNGSFPASLKNAIDVLTSQWLHKPAMVVSVTYSATPGIATVQSLQTILMKLGARVVGPLYTVINAGTMYVEDGQAVDEQQAAKLAKNPLAELMWIIGKNMEK